MTTAFEEGVEKGVEKGMVLGVEKGMVLGVDKGMRDAVARLLVARFGPLSDNVRERLEHLSSAQLDNMLEAVLSATSLKDLGLQD